MTDREGFDQVALADLRDVLSGHVERGALPGLIALVARHDHVHVDVLGTNAVGDRAPMPRDAIFRIASLTKPITAAATMILVDDGVLALDDPIDDLCPELANRRVLASIDAPLHDTVPARRAITVEDLLTFRCGFGAVMARRGTYPIQVAEAELQLATLGAPWPPTPHSPDAWIERLGSLPLMDQPGETWMYNTGAQVLGVLIERAAGRPLETFLRERLFGPLGMTDTAFSVSSGQRDRFTTAYAPDPVSGTLRILDRVDDSFWSAPPALANAAGWLVSTIDDFWAFVQMLVNDGTHAGERILTHGSVAQMTTDHLTASQRAHASTFLAGAGWGFCMAAPAADGTASAPGGFGWDGGTGTTWRSNLAHDLTGILFTQRAMTSPQPPEVFTDFWRGVASCVR
ncbi:MAG: serine hydrolase domain-containing protein [Acidimicrobiia bacterium]